MLSARTNSGIAERKVLVIHWAAVVERMFTIVPCDHPLLPNLESVYSIAGC